MHPLTASAVGFQSAHKTQVGKQKLINAHYQYQFWDWKIRFRRPPHEWITLMVTQDTFLITWTTCETHQNNVVTIILDSSQ